MKTEEMVIANDVSETGNIYKMLKIATENDVFWAIEIDCCGFIIRKEFSNFRQMMNAWDSALGLTGSFYG